MQHIPPVITETPGYVVQPIDFLKTISNVVTAMVYGNARPGTALAFDADILARWRNVAVRAANTQDLPEILETLRMDSNASRSPERYFLQKYAEVAAVLLTSPAYMPDVGLNLSAQLQRHGGHWNKIWVSSPSLGYARPYLSLDCEVNVGVQPIGLPEWDLSEEELEFEPEKKSSKGGAATRVALGGDGIESMPNTLRHALANLCMLCDRPGFSERLIPDAKSLSTRETKEAHWGMKAALSQADRLTAVGLLYLLQVDAFWTRLTEPLYQAAFDIAYALNPRDRYVLDFKRTVRTELLRQIPLHPILESIANMFSSVNVATRFGVKPLAFRHGPTEESAQTTQVSSAMLSVGSMRSMLAQQIVADAVIDHGRLRDLSQTQQWPLELLHNIAPSVGVSNLQSMLGQKKYRSHADVIEWLSRNAKYVNLWPEISRSLGWGGAVGAPAILIEAGGADFVLSDGDEYSHTPAAVLSGLRPGLSLANIKAMGLSIRFDPQFNTGPAADATTLAKGAEPPVKIKWSTLTFDGYMSATKGVEALTRFYMPPGMQMGEQGGETRFVADNADPLAKELVQFFADKSPSGYVRHWYGEPLERTSRITDGVFYMRTSWDAWTENTDEKATQETLIAKYGPDNVEIMPSGSPDLFIFRDAWKMRVPVQLARSYDLELYNELGELRLVFPYDGHILFNDVVELNTSTAAVDSYVSLLRVTPPQLATPFDDEVKPPIQESV